jgi:prepilin-type N-terminal cleavage/methylation domain-containing protein
MTRLRTRREGFTLIEMLVVIGIIAVLAAIILPVYMAAQEKARQGKCLSNMHAIANAIKIAYQDEKSYPVEPYLNGNLWEGGVSALYPDYLTSAQSLACPDDQSVDFNDRNPGSHNPAEWKYSSYNWYDANNDGTWDALTFNRWGLGEADDPDGDGLGTADVNNVANGLPYGVLGGWNQTLCNVWNTQYATIRTKAKWPGLANSTAPDNTIICVCRHHEGFGNLVKRPEVVVRVGGNAGTIKLGDIDFIGQLDL